MQSAAAKGTALTLNFSEALRKSPLPAATAFTLAVDTGTAPTASSISVSGSTASVVLATPVTASQTVTLTYAKPGTNPLQDLAGNDLAAIPSASKVSVTNNTDVTAPTVLAASSGYYGNAGLTTPLTGRVKGGTDIYLKVTFSENVGHTAGTGASARPAIGYKIGSAAEQPFAIVGATAALASGQCQPDAAHPADVYECRHTVASGDDGDFDFRVGTATADTAPTPNRLAAKYTHQTKLVVDTTAPTLSTAAVSGTTLTVTFSENMDTSSSAKAAASAWDVQVAGSARTVSSYTLSGKTATLTLASAATATQTVTVAYDQPSGANAKLADLAGNLLATTATGSELTATNNTGKPTVGFKLGTAALTNKLLSNDADGNIVLTFSEAVYANSSQTAFTDTSVENIITLKTIGPTGSDISYGATVTTSGTNANKVVTVNPDSNLADGVVYVAVSSSYYDSGGNQGLAANRSFTIDATPPTIASAVAPAGRYITLTFSEDLDTSKQAAPSAFIIRDVGGEGTISVDSYTLSSKTATLTMSRQMSTRDSLAMGYTKPSGTATKLTDLAGNEMATLASNPGLDIVDPADLDVAAPTISTATLVGTTLTVTFSEAMKTSPLPAASVFTLSVDTGTAPTVTALSLTGSTATLTLSGKATSAQTVTLTYTKPNANPLEDLAGNDLANITSSSPKSVTNNTDYTAPTVGFKLGSAAITGTFVSKDAAGNLVLTFSESVYRNNTGTAFTNATVDDIITLKQTGATGDDILFGVTLTTSGTDANKVVTVNPSNNLPDGPVYLAVSDAFYDASGNQGTAKNATFTIDATARRWPRPQ